MSYATVSSKGQITLPAKMRRALGIKEHDRVCIEAEEDSIVIHRAPDFFELKGFLGPARSAEEEREAMMEAVSRHVLGLDEDDE
ncbi:AbrB/MazE/SpoVT family DNA-binding domain-containing protein [bacterium]|nr:AbrB/MazE/SpoVT family DNA-binding domain-containing protein [bacterium]